MENQERSNGGGAAATNGGRSLRGFASMDKEKQRAIASKGGRAAHEKGTAHEFNSDEASMAAKKGHERGTAHEFTPDEARVAGRKGGLARAMNRSGQSNGSAESGMSSANASMHHNPAEGMSAAGGESARAIIQGVILGDFKSRALEGAPGFLLRGFRGFVVRFEIKVAPLRSRL